MRLANIGTVNAISIPPPRTLAKCEGGRQKRNPAMKNLNEVKNTSGILKVLIEGEKVRIEYETGRVVNMSKGLYESNRWQKLECKPY